jgi:hypothetical protein
VYLKWYVILAGFGGQLSNFHFGSCYTKNLNLACGKWKTHFSWFNIENSLSDVATRSKAHERVRNGLVLENYEVIWV